MTKNKKIKILTTQTLFFLIIVYVFVSLDTYVLNLSDEEVKVIEEVNERRLAKLQKPLTPITEEKIGVLKEVLKNLPQKVVIQILRELSDEELRHAHALVTSFPDHDIHRLALLFSRLNATEIRRLISLSNKIGVKRTKLLVNAILALHPSAQKNVVNSLFRIGLSDAIQMIYFLDHFSRKEVTDLFEVLASSDNIDEYVDLILRLDKKTVMLLVNNASKLDADLFISLIKDLGGFAITAIELLSNLDNTSADNLLKILNLADEKDRFTLLELIDKISIPHAKRGLELVAKDTRLLKGSAELTRRLQKYLDNDYDPYETMSRAINTASRVNKEARYKGLQQLSEQREVKIRRILKQVDGNQETYTGNVVEQLTEDYDKVRDEKRFTDILSGSDSVTHGGINGTTSRTVPYERKMLRVREVYSGNLQHKKEQILDYFDSNPINVKLLNEREYQIKDPEPLVD